MENTEANESNLKPLSGLMFAVVSLSTLVALASFPGMAAPLSSDSSSITEWRMFQRHLNHSGFTGDISPANISNTSVIKQETTAFIADSPAVVGDYVYMPGGVNDRVYQLNSSNVSDVVANYTTGGNVYNSPAVANRYVYVGSAGDSLYQLNASNISDRLASFSSAGGFGSSPAVAEGYVYAGSRAIEDKVFQLNASNVSDKVAAFSGGEGEFSAPAVANGYVYIGGWDDSLYQLDASNVSDKVAEFYIGPDNVNGVAVGGGYVYFGSTDGLYQLDASNISNRVDKSLTGQDVIGSPAIAHGFVYVGSLDDRIYQLNASNISDRVSEFDTGANIRSSPTVTEDFVYVGNSDGRLYQLNASNVSARIANYSTTSRLTSSPAAAMGALYVGNTIGDIYQFGEATYKSQDTTNESDDDGEEEKDYNLTCSGCYTKDSLEVGETVRFEPSVTGVSNFTIYICGDKECSDDNMLCFNRSGSSCRASAGAGWDLSQNYWVKVEDSDGYSEKVYGGRLLVQKKVFSVSDRGGINISFEGSETRTLYIANSDRLPHSYLLEAVPSEGEGKVFVSLEVEGESLEDKTRFQVSSRSRKQVLAKFKAASCYNRCLKEVEFILKDIDTGETFSLSIPVEIERRQTGVSAPGINFIQYVALLALAILYILAGGLMKSRLWK